MLIWEIKVKWISTVKVVNRLIIFLKKKEEILLFFSFFEAISRFNPNYCLFDVLFFLYVQF